MSIETLNFNHQASIGTKIKDAALWTGKMIKTGFFKLVDAIKAIWAKAAAAFSAAFTFLVANPHIGIPVAVGVGLVVIGSAIAIILTYSKKKSGTPQLANKNKSGETDSDASSSKSESSDGKEILVAQETREGEPSKSDNKE